MSRAAPNAKSGQRRRGRILLWVALAGAALIWLNSQRSGPPEGTVAPSFQLPLVAGGSGTISLAKLRGHPTVIEVFASWCGSCARSAPVLSEAARAKRKTKVNFLGVSTDQNAALARRAHQNWHLPYSVALDDGQFGQVYRISLLPTLLVIDRDGRIVHSASGITRTSTLERWLGELGAARL